MTTQTPAVMVNSVPAAPQRRPGRVFGLLTAEWTKIRSVRSTFWTLILFVVITVGLTAGLTALIVHANGPNAPARDARIIADPVGFILGAGIGLGQLTICVLGVLVITSDAGITYSMFELDTAAKYKIPVICIVYNNNAWGIANTPTGSVAAGPLSKSSAFAFPAIPWAIPLRDPKWRSQLRRHARGLRTPAGTSAVVRPRAIWSSSEV